MLAAAEFLLPEVSGIAESRAAAIETHDACPEEDDILDNKLKWKVLVAGYIVFALVAVFSVISVFTLNNKINTLYHSVQELESEIGSVTQGK